MTDPGTGRPEWVEAVNAGLILPISEEAELPFDLDGLLAEVRAEHAVPGRGIGGFGPDDFVEPLGALLAALEREARLTVLGRWITRRFLRRLLAGRAQIVEYVASDPGVRDEVIAAPILISGAPRTGTTVMHAVLARAAGVRAPEGWELLYPVPPPSPDHYPDPARVALADRELRRPALVVSGLDAIHRYSGRMTKECISAMTFSFRSEEFTARYDVPSYVEWLQACEMEPAYEWHRLVLQILQRERRGATWVLKSPAHLHSLPTLLRVYPDVRLVFTHRDPLAVLGSVTSLVATLRAAHSDTVDLASIGRYHAALYGRSLDRLVDHDVGATLDRARTHHSRYADFVTDPITTSAAVFAAMGLTFGDEVRHDVQARVGARGDAEHSYELSASGLDRSTERLRFARYQQHFAVPDEEGV